MNSRVAEITRCETAAGCPGRCMPVVLLLAALVVVFTSAWIVIDGLSQVALDAPRTAPPVAATVASPETIANGVEAPASPSTGAVSQAYPIGLDEAMARESESERAAAETGFGDRLRD